MSEIIKQELILTVHTSDTVIEYYYSSNNHDSEYGLTTWVYTFPDIINIYSYNVNDFMVKCQNKELKQKLINLIFNSRSN